jgi:cell division protein FtsA
MVKREPEIIVGLDLGTTKTAVVVAERDENLRDPQIIGIGQAKSLGIRKGMIINLEQAVESVKAALRDAESMVGFGIEEVTVAFSGIDFTSVISRGMVSLGRTPRQVTIQDVERVIEAAQSELAVPPNRYTLHTIPVKYSIDGNSGIDDPLGMTGIRLEIELQSVIVPSSVMQNVVNCIERAGVSVKGLVVKSLSTAMGTLTNEEKQSGVISLSVGGGVTTVAMFTDGRPVKLGIIPIGGDHITNDLAYVLKIPISKAEDLKKQLSLDENEISEKELEIEVRGKTRKVDTCEALDVIRSRLEELFADYVAHQLSDFSVHMFPAGIVLSGGVAKTKDLEPFVSDILGFPVRIADPLDSFQMPPGRNDCQYTSAAGIVRYITHKERNPYRFIEAPVNRLKSGPVNTVSHMRNPQGEIKDRHGKEKVKDLFGMLRRSFKELF